MGTAVKDWVRSTTALFLFPPRLHKLIIWQAVFQGVITHWLLIYCILGWIAAVFQLHKACVITRAVSFRCFQNVFAENLSGINAVAGFNCFCLLVAGEKRKEIGT